MAYHDHPAETAASTPVPLKEAAERMGISVNALRGRLKRGTIEGEKDDEGRVFVYLPEDDGPVTREATGQEAYEGDETPEYAEAAVIAEPEEMVEEPAPQTDLATPLTELIEAIQCLHNDLANHDAGLERVMEMHRDQFETNSTLESQIQEMGRQIEAVHTAVKTMGAAFRVHAQETDRLIKALGRSVNGAAPSQAPAPAFSPPTQKHRLFGRRQSDQDDTDTTSS